MTRENSPIHPPLDEGSKRKYMAHIKKCEQSRKRQAIADFEMQLKTYVANVGNLKRKFNNTFVEYVVLEVTLKNYMAIHPPRGWQEVLADQNELNYMRTECRRHNGASPRYHAKVYHNIINDALIEADMHPAFQHNRYQFYSYKPY